MPDDEAVFLTREQLYDEVWSEPMATLARKYGLSDVGLAKICRKLDVPVPWRGYWRKKEVGQKVKRPPLPKLPASATPAMREVTLRRTASGSAIAEPSGPVAEQQRYEALEENRIVVPELLSDPHPLVAKSVKALRRAKRDPSGYLQPKTRPCLAVRVTLDSADRAMCIYDALLKALDARGYPATITSGDQSSTVIRIRDENVAVLIEEKVERVERKSSDPRPRRRLSYRSELDWVPTGRLSLKIDHSYLNGVRRSWGHGKRQRVEGCLNDFVVGLVAASETLKAQHLAREERERQWREAEERRAEEARRREEEAARVRALESALATWQKARLVREYAAELRRSMEVTGTLEPGSPLDTWLRWVDAYADRVDPRLPTPTVPDDPGRPDRFGYRWTPEAL
jgi:hypothetical protein